MTETFTMLREYHKRIQAMLADPECDDDLLLLGISLLDFAILKNGVKSWDHYSERVWGKSGYRLRGTLRLDIRRYDAMTDANSNTPYRKCGSPMIRRGGPCGQSASRQALLTDPDTGRKQWVAGCKRHHEWFDAQVRANRLAVAEEITPVIPAANVGGVLERHIPEIDWEATWLKLDPDWVRPPEDAPLPTTITPKLQLIMGGVS